MGPCVTHVMELKKKRIPESQKLQAATSSHECQELERAKRAKEIKLRKKNRRREAQSKNDIENLRKEHVSVTPTYFQGCQGS